MLCAHGFVQGKNEIPARLPANPLPCLSLEACCCRPLLSPSGPPGVGSLSFPVLLQGWTPRVVELDPKGGQQELSCFQDRASFCKLFPD